MNNETKNADGTRQDHGHQEGQQNNTPPDHHFDGQRRSGNQTQQMSNMMNESEEQRAGKSHGQKDEEGVQDEMRMP
jgi:hypothetical protein